MIMMVMMVMMMMTMMMMMMMVMMRCKFVLKADEKPMHYVYMFVIKMKSCLTQ